jgi:PAS domain-containing protein
MFLVLNSLIRLARGGIFDRPANPVAFTLNNMTQGVALWDMAGRLVVRNDQYVTMYGISRDLAKPGTALVDIIRHRVAIGSLHRDPAQY